jgi:hypothetical protein
MRKTVSLLILIAMLTALLSGCVALPPDAAEAANKAAAGAADAANKAAVGAAAVVTQAATGAAGVMDKAAPLAAGAATSANKIACDSLEGINKALAQVGTLSPETSVADVLAFKQKVDPFVNPMRVFAFTMGLEPVSQFILAYDAFGLLIKTLPADANLGAASNAMSASLAALIGATAQAEAALKCAP